MAAGGTDSAQIIIAAHHDQVRATATCHDANAACVAECNNPGWTDSPLDVENCIKECPTCPTDTVIATVTSSGSESAAYKACYNVYSPCMSKCEADIRAQNDGANPSDQHLVACDLGCKEGRRLCQANVRVSECEQDVRSQEAAGVFTAAEAKQLLGVCSIHYGHV